MRVSSSLSFLSTFLLSLSLSDVVRADHHGARAIGGGSIMRRHAAANVVERDVQLSKRSFDNARLTFYADGLGACGKTNSPSDFIVALNSAQYAGGSHCFETITISFGGKTTQAQIVDECPGCPYGGLDLSSGLFDFFSSESAGVIYGSWDFGSGAAAAAPAADTPQPKPSPTPTPKPSPTPTPPPPSPTPTPTPTPTPSSPPPPSTEPSSSKLPESSSAPPSSSAAPSSSNEPSSSNSAKAAESSKASSSAPAASATAGAGSGTLSAFAQALVGLAVLAVDGPHGQ